MNGGTDSTPAAVVERRTADPNGLTPEESRPAQPYEFLILGFLLFIPGSYHTWIAIMACCEREGYSYDDVN